MCSTLVRRHAPRLLLCLVLVAVSLVWTAPAAPAAESVVRRAGTNRYATAVELSEAYFTPGVPAVYIATGESFADALAGAPAAAAEGAPLLLTASSTLPEVTATELARLDPGRVVVLGGPAAVSDDVVTAIGAAAGAPVTRRSGADRISTAAAVSKAVFAPASTAVVYVASGFGFPDALAGGAAAAAHGAPILLVAQDQLPAATATELDRLAPDRIRILGGTAAVGAGVESALGAHAAAVDRVAGADRFETAAFIAELAFTGPLDHAVLATGLDFPDALAAGAAAAAIGAPVLLSVQSCIPVPVAVELRDLVVDQLVLVGGENVLGPAVAAQTPCGPLPAVSSFIVRYIHPSDVDPVDRVDAIRAEVASYNAWVERETGDRRLRIQRVGTVVDVQTIEVPFTAAEADFERIGGYLIEQGIRTDERYVMAYVEGRESDAGVCGRGGFGIAIYWIQSCAEPSTTAKTSALTVPSAISVHESFHAMGAVPDCAPNGNAGHVTNDEDDVMTAVLTTLDLRLDPGRDDYYGHGRADCPDLARSPFFELL